MWEGCCVVLVRGFDGVELWMVVELWKIWKLFGV